MDIKEVSYKELNDYVEQSNKPHFLQSGAWANTIKNRNEISHCLLIEDNNKIIGSAMLIEKKVLSYTTLYCPRGFICDYYNNEIFNKMCTALKEYAQSKNALYLKVDPDIEIRKLNTDFTIKEENKENQKLIDSFINNGAKHRGFTKLFKESSLPRYTFRVHVDKDNLVETFHQTTKKIIKRNNPYNVEVFKGDINNFEEFYTIMKQTAYRKKIFVEDKNYFLTFYNTLHEYNMSDIYVAKANINILKESYNKMIKEYEDRINNLSPNKKGLIDDLKARLTKFYKELKEIKEIKEEEIILSSIITSKFGQYVWTIHGGNNDSLPFLNANYELYYKILIDAQKEGYKVVDFYGSEGKIDKSSNAYGIYLFKSRFAGDFTEFIGEFDFIYKPFAYKIINSLLVLRRKLKMKLSLIKK